MEMINGIPAWNFELLINIFEDDPYWDVTLQEDNPEAYEAISSIGKKYGSIPEYEKAMELYNKYEPEIIEYYGGQKAVDFIIEEFDIIPVGIIKPPKLKSKLKAKYIEGITYSTGDYYEPVTPEDQVEWDHDRFTEEGNPEGDEIPLLTRSLKRALRATTIKKQMSASSIMFNTDIISQIRNGSPINHDTDKDDRLSLSLEEHEALYEKRHLPKYNKLDSAEITALLKGSDNSNRVRYAYSSDNNASVDVFIKKQMINAGLNPFTDEQKKEMTRSELHRYASLLGHEYVYDEKMMKKLIKKSERAQKDYDREKRRYDKTYGSHTSSATRALANLLTARSRVAKVIGKEDDDE